MKFDFSPLTVYNKWTICKSANGGEKNQNKGLENSWSRGQFATRGLDSRPLTIWTLNLSADLQIQMQSVDFKNINDTDSKSMELGFVDSGHHEYLELTDREKIENRLTISDEGPTAGNKMFAQWWGDV